MIFADLATPAIAAIVAIITFRQYLVSRDQIRHQLFERRFEVYKKTQIFLSNIMQEGTLKEEALPDFYDGMQKAKFLFGKDVNIYLEDIKKSAFAGELRWISEQIGQLHVKFGRYMNFTRH